VVTTGAWEKGWALSKKRLVYWLVYLGKDEVVRCIPYSGKKYEVGEGWGRAGEKLGKNLEVNLAI